MTIRYLAQRVLTGAWTHRELPLAGVEITWGLKGYQLSGTIDPVHGSVLADDGLPILDEWTTALYVEAGGRIRWGGLYVSGRFTGAGHEIDCIGFTGYLDGLPYLDYFGGDPDGIQIDPANALRELWRHAQSYPDGDLGVTVSPTTTPQRIGTEPEQVDFTTGEGEQVSFVAQEDGPYELAWWDHPDMGQEQRELAEETPFDLIETHQWADEAHETVTHRLDIRYPRAGRRRLDLRFAVGENIADVVTITRDGADFANSVIALGRGEGKRTKKFVLESRDDRLRRVSVVDDSSVARRQRLEAMARRRLAHATKLVEVESLTVADPAWELGEGDDILVHTRSPWLGDVAVWSRVLEKTLRVVDAQARLRLARSDRYRHGGQS